MDEIPQSAQNEKAFIWRLFLLKDIPGYGIYV